MRKPVAALEISVGQRELLESVARSQSGAHREVVRAKALLMASEGAANTAIAQALSVAPASVANWRARFAEDGLARLGQVRKGRGRRLVRRPTPTCTVNGPDTLPKPFRRHQYRATDPCEVSREATDCVAYALTESGLRTGLGVGVQSSKTAD